MPDRADFVNKLNMAESEALETQSWLENAVECSYVEKNVATELFQ
jgi:four helix bundle protein